MPRLMRAAALAAALAVTAACTPATDASLTTVEHVDLKRYLGVWHELARYENRFQGPECLNVTAQYGLDKDGDVSVLNSCRNAAGDITDQAEGYAVVADPVSNAKLRVSFFWPFFGDYWIVALADDYSWVIVTAPGREYLWILTRDAMTPDVLKDQLVAKVRALGFDTSQLFFSRR
ncbi:Outer membrane lipoprotein Blc [Alphaproteobacteria bacterium SO-S41]|nr:Outer membrane lipoprotein Blc [Alphaproteobacteria bacterium SO-S41]